MERTQSTDDHEPSSAYWVPIGLTMAGRQAFDGTIQDYAAQLSRELSVRAYRHPRRNSVYTSNDVYAARLAYEQHVREQEHRSGIDMRLLAIVVLAVAAGLALLASYLGGAPQLLLLALFTAIEVIGLLLTWRCWPRRFGGE